MLRKLISKIRQTFTKDVKRPETKPVHKSSRPIPKGGDHRHERRGGGHPPRPTGPARHQGQAAPRPAVAPKPPPAPPPLHAPQPFPPVPKMGTTLTAPRPNDPP